MQVHKFTALDLLDLPEVERLIMRHMMAHESSTPADLQTRLHLSVDDVSAAVAYLLENNWLTQTIDGKLEAVGGQVTRRTSPPPQFWSPFSANPRSFSARDIQVTRVAVPFLLFARSKLAEFNDHGPTHALRVRDYAAQLGYLIKLTPTEHFFLRVAAMFHDIGNIVDRATHNVVSQEAVERLAAAGKLPLTAEEAVVAGIICRWHRKDKEYDPARVDKVGDEVVRTGLLGALIRVADAMDIDIRRSDYSPTMRQVLEFFYAANIHYWTSLEEICGVRIRCMLDIRIQVFTSHPVADNVQIDMLNRDLASTPFTWTVEQIAVTGAAPPPQHNGEKALLAFPFDAHSLVMAAISRKHLRAAGYEVQTLCYADTTESLQAVWRDDFGMKREKAFTQVVLVGGRLQESDAALVTGVLNRLIAWDIRISLLNRHEQTWAWLPWLLQPGLEIVLGGDWAYFWGDAADSADIRWGRVAALCGRDPAQARMRFTEQENLLANGLLMRIREQLHSVRFDDTADWTELSGPLLDRIERDDCAFFETVAHNDPYGAVTAVDPEIQGRVLIFEGTNDVLPTDLYWMLERAIERQGLAMEHGIQFRVPYAFALNPVNNAVDLLAIRHWREEAATAIRFLFPNDPSLILQGNENTVYARLSTQHADELIPRLIAACNS